MGWVLGAEWGQGRAGIGRGTLWRRGSLGGPGLYIAFTPVGRSFGSKVPRRAQSHLPASSSRPCPSFAPSLISWEVDEQASLVHECYGQGGPRQEMKPL